MQRRGEKFSSATPSLETRHQVSGFNSTFSGAQLSFSDYVVASRDMIRKVRAASGAGNLHNIVDGNAPFELEPSGSDTAGKQRKYRRGVLLTHGLSDSPYFMRELAAIFQARGFRVMAVLLPGHGSQPGDLLDVKWQAWLETVAYGTDKLAAEVDEVYLAGYSAGGALSLYHSLQDSRVRALFLFAPAIEISHRAAYAKLHKLYSWLLPRQKWLDIKPDTDIYKYESFAKNAAAQMYALTRALRAELTRHRLEIPVFAVASMDDKTVNTGATITLMSQLAHPLNHLILYATAVKHSVPAALAGKIEWVDSALPQQKILSASHTSILISPEDVHYGAKGEYANCLHYYPDAMDKFNECSKHPLSCWQGEISDENLGHGILRRLMYNPAFPALKISLKQFVDRLQ